MAEIACYGKAMAYPPLLRVLPALLPAMLAATCALNGCSDGGPAYPSLASRPAERLTDTVEPQTVPPAVASPDAPAATPSADLAARLDSLVEQARSGYRTFAGKRAAAENLVSSAGDAPAGSEEWAKATEAMSGIESARTLTAQPLSDLDRIEIDDRMAHPAQNGPDAIAIAQARDKVSAMVAEEDAVLEKLDGRLKR
ncbi:MAG: hypothetical protein M3N34_10690 [Pseudomonadota bacterium]|nr:hypothetical protein [Pseudomonadota bacterium]